MFMMLWRCCSRLLAFFPVHQWLTLFSVGEPLPHQSAKQRDYQNALWWISLRLVSLSLSRFSLIFAHTSQLISDILFPSAFPLAWPSSSRRSIGIHRLLWRLGAGAGLVHGRTEGATVPAVQWPASIGSIVIDGVVLLFLVLVVVELFLLLLLVGQRSMLVVYISHTNWPSIRIQSKPSCVARSKRVNAPRREEKRSVCIEMAQIKKKNRRNELFSHGTRFAGQRRAVQRAPRGEQEKEDYWGNSSQQKTVTSAVHCGAARYKFVLNARINLIKRFLHILRLLPFTHNWSVCMSWHRSL